MTQSKDGIFGSWVATFMKSSEELDAETASRLYGAAANKDALRKDFLTPSKTEVVIAKTFGHLFISRCIMLAACVTGPLLFCVARNCYRACLLLELQSAGIMS